MSAPTSPQSAAAPQPAKMPGEVVRGLVSLWLIVHFFGIVLAIVTIIDLSQSPFAGDTAPSLLLNGVKQAPPLNQYIYALWFDVPYKYTFANNGLFDSDYSLELELLDAEGKKIDSLTWPSPDTGFGERRERFARLALRAAVAADRGDPSFAATIGKAVLSNTGAKELVFRVRRHQPLSLEDVRSSDAAQRDPFHERTRTTAYTAKVRLNLNGEPQVSVPQEARDVAPPTQSSSSSAPSSQPASKSEPTTAPSTSRPAPRRQRADPLPQPERPKKPSSLPPSLFRPSDPAIEPNAPPK